MRHIAALLLGACLSLPLVAAPQYEPELRFAESVPGRSEHTRFGDVLPSADGGLTAVWLREESRSNDAVVTVAPLRDSGVALDEARALMRVWDHGIASDGRRLLIAGRDRGEVFTLSPEGVTRARIDPGSRSAPLRVTFDGRLSMLDRSGVDFGPSSTLFELISTPDGRAAVLFSRQTAAGAEIVLREITFGEDRR